MIKILLIAAGSAIGGVARYLLSKVITDHSNSVFPWGTFAVNVLGCFIIGIVYGIAARHFGMSDNIKLFFTVGFCGGFTTFSTFAHENYLLFDSGNILTVGAYAAASFFAGILMAYAGHALVR